MRKRIVTILSIIIIAAVILSGSIMSKVEQPEYTVTKKYDNIEIRQYSTMTIATVVVDGVRQDAIKNGFKKLAGYIFGENDLKQKISMTAPVMQRESESANHWQIAFVMPVDAAVKMLPNPTDSTISLTKIESRNAAVISFSGMTSDENIQKHLVILNAFLREKGLTTSEKPIFAFYNPPWTLPFLKRNEIIMILK